jgi:rRNA-processing protein FCF1
MQQKFYLDTAIWRDYFEDRKDGIRPLGEFAFQFLKKCEKKGCKVLVSDTVVLELKVYFPEEKVKQIFSSFQGIIQNIVATEEQVSEAKTEWSERRKIVPFKDVLHAVLAKHHCAVLIARDNHFFDELSSIAEPEKPEDITLD